MGLMIILFTESILKNTFAGYLIGGLISLLIMCYLIYSLVKPEKF
jgi:K+-transporting ATPase KdpF subunit